MKEVKQIISGGNVGLEFSTQGHKARMLYDGKKISGENLSVGYASDTRPGSVRISVDVGTGRVDIFTTD